MVSQFKVGDQFPTLVVQTVEGNTLKMPGDITGNYVVALFYRGTW